MLLTSGDVNSSKAKTEVVPTSVIMQSESSVDLTNIPEELPIERKTKRVPLEVRTVAINTKKVILSRGGSPIKKSTGREQINKYVVEIAKKYDIEPELIKSIIFSESSYNPKAKNGNCLGLMQVSTRWHSKRAAKLGVTDFYDSYSNILVGVDYISELITKYKDPKLALMMYNMKHETALKLYNQGEISDYAKKIIARAEQYKKGE